MKIQTIALVMAVGWCLAAGGAGQATSGAAGQEKEDPRIEALLKKPAPLSLADQEALGKAVFAKLSGASDEAKPEFYERYYKIVMDRCPDTNRAHESYWRLTNLYTQAYDEPRHAEVVKILEQFLARYKTSTIVSMKKYPEEPLVFSPLKSLHQAYEDLGQHAKVAAYYDKAAPSGEAAFAIYDYFDYASALDKTGRAKDAVVWYEKFLKKTQGNEDVDFMREIAADRVKELKKK
ncbi:MAG: hypothetical protein FJY80_04340 [Candidatus Aminicenantes bacterium]|nr:hypothetical protein [Candidatus Aminicenantes bacterium]MBM3310717.1 hypothetical protein [Candidatus Aminicenantes bacterium]